MLKHLKKRLPECGERMEWLFKANPDFRALCVDYEEAAKTLAFWQLLSKLPTKQIDRQISDHKELLQELETEIRMTLQEHK
jgi:hypothetical protein